MLKNAVYKFVARYLCVDDRAGQISDGVILRNSRDDDALTRFGRFYLIVSLHNIYFDDTGKQTTGIAHFFKCCQRILASGTDNAKIHIEIKFKLQDQKWYVFDPDHEFDYRSQPGAPLSVEESRHMYNKLRAGFFRAQIRALVSRLRLAFQEERHLSHSRQMWKEAASNVECSVSVLQEFSTRFL